MQKDYEIFIEDLQEKTFHQKGEIPRENMKFEREGGKYASWRWQAFGEICRHHENAWEMCECILGAFPKRCCQETEP